MLAAGNHGPPASTWLWIWMPSFHNDRVEVALSQPKAITLE